MIYRPPDEKIIETAETEMETKERFENLPVEERLAILIHEKLCHRDHDDQCGWFYERDWNCYEHKKYQTAAWKLLEKYTTIGGVMLAIEKAEEILNMAR